jgi:hypothetical protein
MRGIRVSSVGFSIATGSPAASASLTAQRRELVEPAKMHVAERTQVPVVRAVPVVINREVRASWAEEAWVDLAPSAAT